MSTIANKIDICHNIHMGKRMSLVLSLLIPTLPILAAAGTISIGEMARDTPIGENVELQGTVVSRGPWHVLLHDGTNGVTVWDTYRRDFARTGDVIRVSGTVEELYGRKIVRITSHEKTGENFALAAPIPFSVSEFRDAQDIDCRPISVSGIVVDAFRDEFDPDWALMFFAPLNAHIAALVYDPNRTLKLGNFIDAEVRITGNFNSGTGGGRPHLGRHIITFFTNSVSVLKPAPSFPDAPDARQSTIMGDGHRQCLSGTVLATWNGNSFFLKTDNGLRVRIHLAAGSPLPTPGASVSVAGFPSHNIFFTEFANAIWRAGKTAGGASEAPTDILPAELLTDNQNQQQIKYQMDGRLIRLRGKVLSASPVGETKRCFFLLCENETIKVEATEFPPPKIDSVVEVTGICRFSGDDSNGAVGLQLSSFSVLPRTTEDIRIIRNPPWWTPAKVISAAAILLALLLAGLVWNFILQKLVTRKGRELARESLAHLKAELRVDERTALAVELHDTIAQNLTGVSMQMEGVDEAHRIGSPRLGELIGKARHALDSCRTELRNCLWDLRNDAFDGDDVSAIIRKAIAPHLGSAAADVKLDLQRSHISDSTFHALLCIIRELVINAVRHGAATQIDIRGEMTASALKITVRDNGRGFDPNDRPGPDQGHFGLLGIQERLDRLGGTLDINSTPGHGAEFTITVES